MSETQPFHRALPDDYEATARIAKEYRRDLPEAIATPFTAITSPSTLPLSTLLDHLATMSGLTTDQVDMWKETLAAITTYESLDAKGIDYLHITARDDIEYTIATSTDDMSLSSIAHSCERSLGVSTLTDLSGASHILTPDMVFHAAHAHTSTPTLEHLITAAPVNPTFITRDGLERIKQVGITLAINESPLFQRIHHATQDLNITHIHQRLGQLKADCDYFLGEGQRYEGHLAYPHVATHIRKMRYTWASLPTTAKPAWLTATDIDTYERRMSPHSHTINLTDKHAIKTHITTHAASITPEKATTVPLTTRTR